MTAEDISTSIESILNGASKELGPMDYKRLLRDIRSEIDIRIDCLELDEQNAQAEG